MLTILARLVVGGYLAWMGWSKATDPVAFLKLLRQYDLFPADSPWMINTVAVTLPWVEISAGLMLVLGLLRRGAALTVLLLLAVFTAVVARRGLQIAEADALAFCAVAFDCGCGGGVVNVCRKLAENAGLMLLTLLVLLRGGPTARA